MRALLAILIIVCPTVLAAPKAQHPSECRFFWDVALVSRALVLEGVERKHAGRILSHIYNMQDDPRVIEIVYTILDVAYRQTGGGGRLLEGDRRGVRRARRQHG